MTRLLRAFRLALPLTALCAVGAWTGCSALLSFDGITGGPREPDAATARDSGDAGTQADGTGQGDGSQGDATQGDGNPSDGTQADAEGGAPDDGAVVDDAPNEAQPCGDGGIVCDGACIDPASDSLNCGRCGNVCPSGRCGASILADMSTKPAAWSFNGSAQYDPTEQSAVMTSANGTHQAGSVVYEDPVTFGWFTANFQFRIGYGGGARDDGMGFMFQTTGPTAVGGYGHGLGMTGLAGWGVEMDIYDNSRCGDSTDNHVGVDSLAECDAAANTGLPTSLFSLDVTSVLDLADGKWHTATVKLDREALSVFVDDAGLADHVGLPGYVVNVPAYFGFGGGTGNAMADAGGSRTEVKNVSITLLAPRCL
jgi:hypothetical protein